MYWKLVHGGGPCISRKNKEIDSPRQCGYMEAVFRMQCFGRMVIAKFERNELYWRNLSRNASEVRRVLAQDQLEKIEAEAKTSIQSAQETRQSNKLEMACLFTQRNWRQKKTCVPKSRLAHACEVEAPPVPTRGCSPAGMSLRTRISRR